MHKIIIIIIGMGSSINSSSTILDDVLPQQ